VTDHNTLSGLAIKAVQGLHPYVPGKPVEELERELGISDIVKLASNENPLGMSELAKNAIADLLDEGSRYPDGNGYTLKYALQDYLSTLGHKLGLESLTLGNGSNDLLDIITRCFANHESEIIFSEYSFAVYAISCQSVGAQAVVAPAKDWGHDLDAMQALISDKTKLIFIANPNNPTGTSLTNSELKSFLEKVPSNVIVVLDEAYCEYISDKDFPDGISFLSSFPNLIVTRTFSKAWGLASLRVGYAVSHPEIANILNRVRHPFNVNSFALAAAAAVLQDKEYLARSIECNAQGMKQIVKALDDLGLDYIPSKGNFLTFDTGVNGTEVFEKLLKLGVIVRPVANYGMPSYLRVSIGLESENARFIEALTALREEGCL
jgi:histidinol-phosphate aminotransferase